MLSTGCPGSEWESLLTWTVDVLTSVPYQLHHDTNGGGSPYSVQVTGKTGMRQLMVGLSNGLTRTINSSSGQTLIYPMERSVASTQPAVIADALVNTATLWSEAVWNAKPAKGHGSAFNDQ